MPRTTLPILIALLLALLAGECQAHTSEQGFVLLLPTGVYTIAGVLAVALTVLVLAFLPEGFSGHLFTETKLLKLPRHTWLATLTSLFALICLITLLTIGFVASHDPLKNLLPLFIWTIWWIGFVCVQGLLGNVWYWFNPWVGVYQLIRRVTGTSPTFKLHDGIGTWPAVFTYLLFSCFALADTSPEDPNRLAVVVAGYYLWTLAAMLLFGGSTWLQRGECFTVLLNAIGQLSAVGTKQGHVSIGLPGWQLLSNPVTSTSYAVFVLTLLAVGSFDGLNETFWWLGKIGINPLEFPGRSAVVTETVSGLMISTVALVCVFAACIWIGNLLANKSCGPTVTLHQSFTHLSAAILPIAVAYHFAHFLTTFLVNSQYALAAATDPLQNGRDLLSLGRFYVTTGFFNTRDTVKLIWLTQAGAVVIGHMLSILVAHSIAERLWKDSRKALISQIPLAIFMILYTFLGLWLLAAPRGA